MSRTLRCTRLRRIEQVFASRPSNAVGASQAERPVSLLFREARLVCCTVCESIGKFLFAAQLTVADRADSVSIKAPPSFSHRQRSRRMHSGSATELPRVGREWLPCALAVIGRRFGVSVRSLRSEYLYERGESVMVCTD